MALQSIKGGLWVPNPAEAATVGGTPSFSNSTALTANTHRYAVIFQVPKTGSFHKLHCRYGTVTSGATTRMQAKFETIGSTTGDPSGSAYGSMVAGTSSIQPASNTWDTITLGTDATATVGDFVAACLDFQTFNASDSVTFSLLGSAEGSSLPYTDTFGASWAKSNVPPVLAVEYSDGTFEFISDFAPYTTITNTAYNSGSSPAEYGLRFSFPYPCRLRGVKANFLPTAATQNYKVNVYLAGATVANESLTVSHRAWGGSNQRQGFWQFVNPQSISANAVNRVSFAPQSATNVTLQIYTYNAVAIMDQDEGGQSFYLSTLSGGTWTDTTTQRPSIYLLIDENDDAVSTGGVKVHPGMDGGCRA